MTNLIITDEKGKSVNGEGKGFEFFEDQPVTDDQVRQAFGGTELMYNELMERLPEDLKEQFQIIPSRVRELDGRPAILWLHDLFNDPEVHHLGDPESLNRFERFVFVSYMQMQPYQMTYQFMDHNRCVVLRNAIEPFERHEKPEDCINLIYHTTPHRGLEILVPVFEELDKRFPEKNLHLDVFSSFAAYGWEQRDEPYQELFERCRNHPNISYHGFQHNHIVREALKDAHIFAYPSIWPETSCIAAIEAAAAGCEVVCPGLGALPETMAGFATMYQFNTNPQRHAEQFFDVLASLINQPRENTENRDYKLNFQATYFNSLYNWDARANEWIAFLRSVAAGLS